MNIEKIREEFPVTRNNLFLDHAKVSPLPRRVRDKIQEFSLDASENGTANYTAWMKEVESVRAAFAQLINADLDEVAFVKNTSEGISIVANGIDWKEGDNVVIPDIEFPANVYPWLNLGRLGVETRFAKAVRGRVPFEQIVSQADSRTRVISVSSVECNSGFRHDLNRIGAYCKEKGILFCVDAIQSLGALPMDVKKDRIDFLAADGHKWMLSAEGLGGFYISSEALEKIHPAVVGWDSVINAADYMNYDFTLRPGAKRFEEGSFNVMSIHAFGAALSLFHEFGMENIQERILKLGDCILGHLKRRKIQPHSSTLPEERSGIVAFAVNGDLEKMKSYFTERRVAVTLRDGLLRLSPHFYNTEKEIDRLFTHLDEYSNYES